MGGEGQWTLDDGHRKGRGSVKPRGREQRSREWPKGLSIKEEDKKGAEGNEDTKGSSFPLCTPAGRPPVCDPRVLPKLVFLKPKRREKMRETGGVHTILEVVLGVGKENRRCTYN